MRDFDDHTAALSHAISAFSQPTDPSERLALLNQLHQHAIAENFPDNWPLELLAQTGLAKIEKLLKIEERQSRFALAFFTIGSTTVTAAVIFQVASLAGWVPHFADSLPGITLAVAALCLIGVYAYGLEIIFKIVPGLDASQDHSLALSPQERAVLHFLGEHGPIKHNSADSDSSLSHDTA